ncbi:MAG: proline--tRNA ligase [Candidatus Cloacimonetes bacterium]|nr:proline--tRNA ligase [Candidatus Cloacimonadota bacterium]
MTKQRKTAITPTRAEDYPQWYQQVIKFADLAENSEVRGCMVIKPWGYAIWENIQANMDELFKESGHVNAYFPLFIPKSYFEKEAEHVEGFAKECAVVTHSRLEEDGKGGLKPAGELSEELIVRPTSETIIGASFSRWVNSYRDLPLLINQWCNVVRWELRTRMFLRTTEFLWQEGHTVHETREEAQTETFRMLDIYARFAEEYLAIPVIKGEKTEAEKFPGALNTYCIEAMMQDRKALQSGTSHFLGQNFARASNIKFQSREGREELAWTTSWGVSTRLIGAVIMAHGDDDGLILPPRIAPIQIVIIPIYRNEEDKKKIFDFIDRIKKDLYNTRYHDHRIRLEVDDRELGGGEKLWSWIKKGVPVRLEIGPRDVSNDSVFMGRRDREPQEKESVKLDLFLTGITALLDEIQQNIYNRALDSLQQNSVIIDDRDEFYRFFTPRHEENPEIHGGFSYSHWCGSSNCETKIKEDLKVTIRCIPLTAPEETGRCICCGGESAKRVIFAKNY